VRPRRLAGNGGIAAWSIGTAQITENQHTALPDDAKGGELVLKLFALTQAFAANLRDREEGQTMAEYGVVLAVITLAVVAAISLLSDNVRSAIESVANILP
jgi:Flp pilus assembly pilin Flp